MIPLIVEKFIAEAEYAALEELSPIRHEYFQGRIYSLYGVGGEHTHIIIDNLSCTLHDRFRGAPFHAFAVNQRVLVEATRLYTYPDVVIFKNPGSYSDAAQYNLVNPILVAEVLSDSTRIYDCGGKLEHYRQIPSLKHILLVDSNRVMLTHWQRQGERWVGEQFFLREDEVLLDALDSKLSLAQIYQGVELSEGYLCSSGPESCIRTEEDSRFF